MTGFSRHPLLGGDAVLEGAARLRGSLYDFGEYPGVVLDDRDGGGWVAGELYRLRDLAARLAELDGAEGYDPADEARSLYVRRRASVLRADGARPDAWVYVYNDPWGAPSRGPRIPSGDWRAHLGARSS
jgi:gamma-glutamylcyclotransferase (GGCT)/AIG2-like uncharacterized protein YtfP